MFRLLQIVDKNVRLSGPVQLTPVLFKGQLYFPSALCSWWIGPCFSLHGAPTQCRVQAFAPFIPAAAQLTDSITGPWQYTACGQASG